MQRVMIIGQPGAGKFHLAQHLRDVLNLPVYHMDWFDWQPDGTRRPDHERTALAREVHARDRWIFEGGHSATWPERLDRADTLIWLDMPLSLRLWRAMRPVGAAERAARASERPEQTNQDFLAHVWRTRNTGRARCAELYERARPDHRAFHITRPVQARGFALALGHAIRMGNLTASGAGEPD